MRLRRVRNRGNEHISILGEEEMISDSVEEKEMEMDEENIVMEVVSEEATEELLGLEENSEGAMKEDFMGTREEEFEIDDFDIESPAILEPVVADTDEVEPYSESTIFAATRGEHYTENSEGETVTGTQFTEPTVRPKPAEKPMINFKYY